MNRPYLQRRLARLIAQLDAEGLAGIGETERYQLAYFFVQGAMARHFEIADDDEETRQRFLRFFREEVAENPEYVPPPADHKTSLRTDAGIIRDHRYPVGALILYATWVEHWVNGIILSAGQQRGLPRDILMDLVRAWSFRDKLGTGFERVGLPTLECRGQVQHLMDLRNEYVHYKWTGVAADATWDVVDQRLTHAVESAEDLMRTLVAYAAEHVYRGIPECAERVLGAEGYREWMQMLV